MPCCRYKICTRVWSIHIESTFSLVVTPTHAVFLLATTCWRLLIGPLLHWSVMPLAFLNKHKYSRQGVKWLNFHKIILSMLVFQRGNTLYKHFSTTGKVRILFLLNEMSGLRLNGMQWCHHKDPKNWLFVLQSGKCPLFASWSYQNSHDFVRLWDYNKWRLGLVFCPSFLVGCLNFQTSEMLFSSQESPQPTIESNQK